MNTEKVSTKRKAMPYYRLLQNYQTGGLVLAITVCI